MSRPPLSLKARAIALLAQREHSATELRRKLMRVVRKRDLDVAAAAASAATATAFGAGAETDDADEEDSSSSSTIKAAEEVDALLVWLQAQGYLDEARFVESRIHTRAARHGNLRIKQELAQHGLALDASQAQALKDSEFERAKQIWQRKFGGPAADRSAQAKQMRFLAGRGFSADVVRRLLRNPDGE